MKTSHQLAKELLAGPDLPVFVHVDAGGDSVNADLGDVKVTQKPHITYGEFDEDGERQEIVTENAIGIVGWASNTPLCVDWG